MEVLEEISANLQAGKAKIVREKVQEAIDAGIPAPTFSMTVSWPV